MVHLVDLPDVTPAVLARLQARVDSREELRRAGYRGRPGHPVFIPRAHWAELIGSLSGDQGANAYLRANDVAMIECSDLASGHDVDHIDRQSSAALPTNPGAPEAASLIDAGTQ